MSWFRRKPAPTTFVVRDLDGQDAPPVDLIPGMGITVHGDDRHDVYLRVFWQDDAWVLEQCQPIVHFVQAESEEPA